MPPHQALTAYGKLYDFLPQTQHTILSTSWRGRMGCYCDAGAVADPVFCPLVVAGGFPLPFCSRWAKRS